jgi:hypothetical protein
MVSVLTEPDSLLFLLNNANAVFIIEDIENLNSNHPWGGKNRDFNFPISTLLSITDGLLSDCLHIQIICSYNIDTSKVRNALLPKSRLIAQYEFKELGVNKVQALSKKLALDMDISKPLLLEDIYSQFDPEKHQPFIHNENIQSSLINIPNKEHNRGTFRIRKFRSNKNNH